MQSLETKVELSDYGSVAASVLVDQEKLKTTLGGRSHFNPTLWDIPTQFYGRRCVKKSEIVLKALKDIY